jgi:hypothetical protein
MERHDNNYYELYYEYYEFFADDYADALSQFEDDIQDGEWSWYWPLFENLSDLETLLAGINTLNPISLDMFKDFYVDGDENYYDYYEYEYWIYLNELLPFLQEGKDVFNQIVTIEELDLDNLDATTIKAISDMYEDYLALSEDAQELLDPEYVQSLLSLIVEQVEGDIEELPGTVEDFDALFNDAETKEATINGLLGAWNKYQAMSDDLKEDMDPEARAHLETLYARYLELNKTSVDLWMVVLIIVHLSAGVYFAFKKRDILVKPVQ